MCGAQLGWFVMSLSRTRASQRTGTRNVRVCGKMKRPESKSAYTPYSTATLDGSEAGLALELLMEVEFDFHE